MTPLSSHWMADLFSDLGSYAAPVPPTPGAVLPGASSSPWDGTHLSTLQPKEED